MEKLKFQLEYPLKNASRNILWNSIYAPLGLTEWFADGVTVKGDEFTFSWEKNELTAYRIDAKPNTSVRFQWEEDEDTEYYFEMEIVSVEVTGDLTLIVTDFAEPGEQEDLKLLWDKQIDVLRRKTGI
ncbi:MAG TPA: START-like domain-containing protein [Paludibacter sp.]|nr:START-like domain-containing protein [Paludibacter sp.]